MYKPKKKKKKGLGVSRVKREEVLRGPVTRFVVLGNGDYSFLYLV